MVLLDHTRDEKMWVDKISGRFIQLNDKYLPYQILLTVDVIK